MTKQQYPRLSCALGMAAMIATIVMFHQGVFNFRSNAVYSAFFMVFYAVSFALPIMMTRFLDALHGVLAAAQGGDDSLFQAAKFGGVWSAYRGAFITDNRLHLMGKTRTRAGEYYNADTLCDAWFGFPVLRALRMISGTFIGIGILGTFIGFSRGIPRDMTIQDIHDLDPLFEGLKTAFNTSIIGVFSSVFYRFFIVSPLSSDAEKTARSISEALDAQYYVSDAGLLAAYAEGTTAPMASIADRLSHNFENAASQSTQQIGALTDSMKAMTEEISNRLSDSFDNIVSKALKEMNSFVDSMAQTIQAAAAGFDGTTSSMKAMTEEISSRLSDSFDSIVSKALKEMNSFVDSMAQTIQAATAGFDGTTKGIAQQIDALASVSSDFSSLSGEISKTAAVFNTIPNRIEESHTRFIAAEKDLYNRLSPITAALQDAVTNLTGSYDAILYSIKETLDKINVTKGQIDDILVNTKVNVDQTGENLLASIDQYKALTEQTQMMLTDFKSVDQSVKAVFEQIEAGLTQYVTQTNNNLTQFMDHFADGTKTYTQGFTDSNGMLKESITSLDDTLVKLAEITSRLEAAQNAKGTKQ